MSKLFPPISPYSSSLVKVNQIHSLYVEESGNKKGFPVIFFHGGPGSATNPDHRRYFDPKFYRIILFDQRGCGQSKPSGEIKENTSSFLVEDIIFLKKKLGIRNCLLFGGSWGSTLALLFCIKYPEFVAGMILRGVFTGTLSELEWFLFGLKNFLPEHKFFDKSFSTTKELLDFFHDKIFSSNTDEAFYYSDLWSNYEASIMQIGNTSKKKYNIEDKLLNLNRCKVQIHFIKNQFFLNGFDIVENVKFFQNPVEIIQGRIDWVCPPITAYKLAKNLKNANIQIVEDGGNSGSGASVSSALVEATEHFKNKL